MEKKYVPCPDCQGRGRKKIHIMMSYEDKPRSIDFDFLMCGTCRGSGYVTEKVAKDASKSVKAKIVS